jgi:general stress protein YciG
MTKKQAGQIGGRVTVQRHGSAHMAEIGRRGASVTWSRYHLSPVGQSGWAMVDRQTNEVKTFINYIPGR